MNVVPLKQTEVRTCISCGQEKSTDHFTWKEKSKSGIRNRCDECSRARDRERYRRQIKQRKESSKWAVLKWNHGLTKQQWHAILETQSYRCAICSSGFVIDVKSMFNPCVDHDHATKRIRGLLCRRCNQGLGLLQDSSFVASSAAEYLRRHGR